MKDIAAHLACCHVTTLLLFLQPTAARVGKEREPDRSEACWLDPCSQAGWHSYQSLIFNLNIFICFQWFWFKKRGCFAIKQRWLLCNKSTKPAGVDRYPKHMTNNSARSDQHSNRVTGNNNNRMNGISSQKNTVVRPDGSSTNGLPGLAGHLWHLFRPQEAPMLPQQSSCLVRPGRGLPHCKPKHLFWT